MSNCASMNFHISLKYWFEQKSIISYTLHNRKLHSAKLFWMIVLMIQDQVSFQSVTATTDDQKLIKVRSPPTCEKEGLIRANTQFSHIFLLRQRLTKNKLLSHSWPISGAAWAWTKSRQSCLVSEAECCCWLIHKTAGKVVEKCRMMTGWRWKGTRVRSVVIVVLCAGIAL